MSTKNKLIHIKLDYPEALQSRKDVLRTQESLIKIAQSMRRYRALRLHELELKIELYKKLKEAKASLQKTKTFLPKLEIPKILKKHEEEMEHQKLLEEGKIEIKEKKQPQKKEKTKEKKEKKEPTDDLEKQLLEIQKKLNSLG